MPLDRSVALLLLLFLLTNFLGLMAAHNLQQYESIQETAAENQSAESGVYFFALIGAATLLMLILYKYKAQALVKTWFYLALFLTTLIFFDVFIPTLFAILVAVLLVAARFKVNDPNLMNLLTMFSFAGAGAFFGSVIGFKPALLLFVILAVYDYFSVNISKHMIALAKSGMDTNTFMGFTYPKKDGGIPMENEGDIADADIEDVNTETGEQKQAKMRVGVLGGGDIVIPLMFASSLLPTYGFLPAIAAIIGAAIGLTILLQKAQQGTFYPAIPPVAIGSIVGFGIAWIAMNAVQMLL